MSGEDLRKLLEQRIDARVDEVEAGVAHDAERRTRRPRAGAARRLLRDQPRPGLGRGARPFRQPAQRLLAAAARGALHLAAVRAGGAVRAAERGRRRHERRLPHDARLGRPAPRRLRRLGRAARAARRGAEPRLDRLRRQGGLPRRLRRAAGARRAGADARRDAAVRAPVDVAGERGRAVVGAAALVHGARRPRLRAAAAQRRARARARPGRQRPARALRDQFGELVVDARRRHRSRRERRDALARELSEEVGLHRFELGPLIWTREHWLVNPTRWGGQRERHYLVRTNAFEPAPVSATRSSPRRASPAPPGSAVEQLDTVMTGPRRLAALVRELLRNGPPREPVDAGV